MEPGAEVTGDDEEWSLPFLDFFCGRRGGIYIIKSEQLKTVENIAWNYPATMDMFILELWSNVANFCAIHSYYICSKHRYDFVS